MINQANLISILRDNNLQSNQSQVSSYRELQKIFETALIASSTQFSRPMPFLISRAAQFG